MREHCAQRLIRQCDEAWGAKKNLRNESHARSSIGSRPRLGKSLLPPARAVVQVRLVVPAAPFRAGAHRSFARVQGEAAPKRDGLGCPSGNERWPWRPNQMVLLGEDFWQVSYQMEFTIYFTTSVALHLLAGVPYRNSALLRPYERVIKGMLSELSGAPPPQNVYRGHGILRELEGKSAAERFARHRAFGTFVQTELQWLIRLREAVETDGRRLVLVRIPHRADYLQAVHASGMDLWAPAAPIREGVPLLDFFELQPPNPICFANSDHLSPEGADWFTPIVERDLIRLNTHQQE